MLPETDSVKEVLLRPTFAFSFCSTSLVMLLLSYFMEKTRVESASAPAVFVDGELCFNVLTLCALFATISFTNSYQVTRAVATGQSPPLKLSRLQSLPWPLSHICGREGERRLIPFVVQMIGFPGIFTVAVLYALSLAVNGPSRVLEWRMPLRQYLAASTMWRFVVSATIFTMNYLAAHNPTQPLLIPTPEPEPEQGSAPRMRENGHS